MLTTSGHYNVISGHYNVIIVPFSRESLNCIYFCTKSCFLCGYFAAWQLPARLYPCSVCAASRQSERSSVCLQCGQHRHAAETSGHTHIHDKGPNIKNTMQCFQYANLPKLKNFPPYELSCCVNIVEKRHIHTFSLHFSVRRWFIAWKARLQIEPSLLIVFNRTTMQWVSCAIT